MDNDSWIKYNPSEFYNIVMYDDINKNKICTTVEGETYYFICNGLNSLLFTKPFNLLIKEELTECFKTILRKNKLEKICLKLEKK